MDYEISMPLTIRKSDYVYDTSQAVVSKELQINTRKHYVEHLWVAGILVGC